MDAGTKRILWQQFGGAIDMLANAITACPEPLWGDRSRRPEYWAMAFHALFWLDLYLSPSAEGFHPPEPFGLEELDPAGVLPPRVYTQAELLAYLAHGREKCRAAVAAMTPEESNLPFGGFEGFDLRRGELMLYNLRHVQHHAAQLDLLLRQAVDDAPRWVRRASRPLEGP